MSYEQLCIEIVATADLSPAYFQDMMSWLYAGFGDDGFGYTWNRADYHLLGTIDDSPTAGQNTPGLRWYGRQVVTHLDISPRQARVGQSPLCLGGIGGVITLPEYRRRGFAAQALHAAQQFIVDTLKADFGLLICSPMMTTYYRKFGWQLVSDVLVCDQPKGKVRFSGPVMILPGQKQFWPQGEIDLCGLPW
jgi:predicted acetyltransferase